MKKCTKCKEEKELTEFYKDKTKKDGLYCYCKTCAIKYREENKKHIKEQRKKFYKINNEIIKEKSKKYHKENKEKRSQYYKEYNKKNKDVNNNRSKIYYKNNKEKVLKYIKKYYIKNKENIIKNNIKYQLNRKKTDTLFKLRCNIASLICSCLKKQGYTKRSQTYKILGCTYEEFKIHLENQFTDGMTWENQGQWHLDHIYPVSLAKNEEELIKLNHYTNFQPLWAKDNLKKHNKILSKQLRLI